MPFIDAVLFDYGKVLSGPPNPEAWASLRRHSRLNEQTLQREYWAHRDDYDRGALSAEAYWTRIAECGGVVYDAATRTALNADDLALWTDLNPPMIEWVSQLHAAGVRTGILSNIGDVIAAGISAKFDWIGSFHHLVWSHALHMRKPEPAIYRAAAAGLQTAPEHILFIDDREENIRGAEAIGMQGILYESHEDFVSTMRQRGFGDLLTPLNISLKRA